MNHRHIICIGSILTVTVGGLTTTWAAKPPAPVVALAPGGQKIEASLAAQLASLKTELSKSVPAVDEANKSALLAAKEAVKKAKAETAAAQQQLGKIAGAAGLVGHRKNKWIAGANKGIAAAEAALKKAANDTERAAANKDLAHWQDNLKQGQEALVKAEADLAAAKVDEAKNVKSLEAAKAALADATAKESSAAKALLNSAAPFVASDKLDAKLVPCVVLANATPRGLGEF